MKRNVLILESSQAVQKQYAHALERLEFLNLEFIDDGYEALGRLLKENYDCIVASSNSKTIGGSDLLTIVRMVKGPNSRIPNVLIGHQEESLNEGSADNVLINQKFLLKDLELILMKVFKEDAQNFGPPPIPKN